MDALKKFFSTGLNRIPLPKLMDTDIPDVVARPRIAAFQSDLRTKLGAAYTESVSFYGPSLQKWITDLAGKGDYDEIRLEFGIYNQEMIDNYALPAGYLGRMTIFIRAYYQGSLAVSAVTHAVLPAYNVGHLNP